VGSNVHCFCCEAAIRLARKVKLRSGNFHALGSGPPDPVAYLAYVEDMTFRWAFICHACYRQLDVVPALAEISGRPFNMAASSCNDRAAIVNETKYQAFQRREAEKMVIAVE
jgi:hypothetical protein